MPCVLVVDASPEVTRLLRRTLVSEGYEVIEAAQDRNAGRYSRTVKPDLIVLGGRDRQASEEFVRAMRDSGYMGKVLALKPDSYGMTQLDPDNVLRAVRASFGA